MATKRGLKTGNSAEHDSRRSRGKKVEGSSFPVAPPMSDLPEGYSDFLTEIKSRVEQEHFRVVIAANSALVLLYWDIGKSILDRQALQGWGAKVIDRLASDLAEAYPDMKGFSPRNLKYMRAFANAWPTRHFVQEELAQLTWYNNLTLLERLEDTDTRIWYARAARSLGWSRNVLAMQIDSRVHLRQGQALHNFNDTLAPAESKMAAQIFKDPYLFDFLGTTDTRKEREVEQGLIDHIQKFLLELGAGFAFVGRQVLLEVGDQDFFVDLLFYHLKLRCFVVIELKSVPFDPSFVGQTNLYLSACDDQLRHPDDKPTIGLLLCRSKNKIVVEYALRNVKSPIGVAEWETMIVDSLPDDLKTSLPTIEALESELAGRLQDGKEMISIPSTKTTRKVKSQRSKLNK